ncbi:MAG TPA: type II secretion system F family protein [Sporichthya sp.]|nr:type II secretion system F family protein [Sporichthya sp.]
MSLLAAVAAAVAVGLLCPGAGRGLERLGPAPSDPGWRAPLVRVKRWRPGARRRAETERIRVVEFASALAAEVRAGRPARAAVVAAVDGGAAGTWGAGVRAAAAGDADVGSALAAAAEQPGADDLRDVAACWQLAEVTGAGLGGALEEVAAAAGERSAHRARVRAQLAGVRTTGWLLAALPLVGMALAASAGARPWQVLLGTPSGLALLVLGLGLDAAGVLWLQRMARRVEVLA